MKIESIQIYNFRLLKSFKLDLEESLSLILGKNNTGKTSILTCLDKFINSSDKKKITAEDFNVTYKAELEKLICDGSELEEDIYCENIYGLRLRLIIDYNEEDDTCNISDLMMDLEPDHNKIIIGYDYSLQYKNYKEIRSEYKKFKLLEKQKFKDRGVTYAQKGFDYFFKNNVEKYFHYRWKSIQYDYDTCEIVESSFNDLEKTKGILKDILNFKYISAKRNVANKENEKTLSTQTSEIYERSEKNDEDEEKIQNFKEIIAETDIVLDNVYAGLFNEITEKVRQFGGIKKDESLIKIISSLQRRELLKGNTTVVYKHDDSQFPEHYNGLGYMNLISMIFEIEILLHEFRKGKDEKPADINLLFIEEPEAHTHPQMQYVFIDRITNLLQKGFKIKDETYYPFQYVISTHSSHIVANCKDFNSIKYLRKEKSNDVRAKNLKDLERDYSKAGEEQNFRFLKQYLTLNRAELFFADKAIFIEGDTERILLPAMMRKIDIENTDDENELPILSQNISIIEVGNYSHIFEKFINFLKIKSIIITDLDAVKKDFVRDTEGKIKQTIRGKDRTAEYSCRTKQGQKTSNPSLLFFFPSTQFSLLLNKTLSQKRFSKNTTWEEKEDGHLQLVIQTEEAGYCARSFEDAFFSIPENLTFVKKNRSKFSGLKNMKYFYDTSKDAFDLAQECIDSKGSFAIDILRFSTDNYSNWQIPAYIKEGLLWLRKD